MDFRKIDSYLAVCRTGSISRAAAVLSLGQAVVSKHVRSLEDELGTQLFYRDGRGTTLTQSGEVFREHALEMVASLDLARERIESARQNPIGEIALALPPSVGLILTVPLASRFKHEFPNVRLRIVEAFSGHVQEWLMTGQIDVAVLYDARPVPNLVADKLLTEDLCLLGPVEHESNPAGDAVDLAEVAKLPLILPNKPHGLRLIVDRAFAQIDAEPSLQMEVDAMPSTLRLVQSGWGYTILSRSTVHDRIEAGIIRAWRIMNPAIPRTLLLATTTQRPHTPASRELARIVREEVGRQVQAGIW